MEEDEEEEIPLLNSSENTQLNSLSHVKFYMEPLLSVFSTHSQEECRRLFYELCMYVYDMFRQHFMSEERRKVSALKIILQSITFLFFLFFSLSYILCSFTKLRFLIDIILIHDFPVRSILSSLKGRGDPLAQ